MANTLLTSAVIARLALAHLYENTIMLPLMYRAYEPEFQPGRGATITVRSPGTFTSNSYNGTNVVVQNMTETPIPIVLDEHEDVTFRVTSKERTLNVVDFSEQFVAPAMMAICQKVDRDIIAKIQGSAAPVVGDGVSGPVWSNPKVLTRAGRVLDEANVPEADRSVVVGPEMKEYWVNDPLFNRVDQSGDTTGLRRASLGAEKFGFTPYMSQNIKNNIGFGLHKTAVAFATAPLEVPEGAASATIVNYKGLNLRVVKDYDMQLKADLVSIDLLYGIKVLDDDRLVLIDGSGSGS